MTLAEAKQRIRTTLQQIPTGPLVPLSDAWIEQQAEQMVADWEAKQKRRAAAKREALERSMAQRGVR